MPSIAPPFQSHLGSILPAVALDDDDSGVVFQSHLGSILPPTLPTLPRGTSSFQSHLGSILPLSCAPSGSAVVPFQSHLGSILPVIQQSQFTVPTFVSIPPWFDFAGILSTYGANVLSLFQSHLGSILPPSPPMAAGAAACFNPTLVRFCRGTLAASGAEAGGFNPTLVRFCRPKRITCPGA